MTFRRVEKGSSDNKAIAEVGDNQRSLVPKTFPVPAVPQSTSPVPWLLSLHGAEGRGDYGDPKYRGNCSGLLIRDLVQFFKPKHVLDPMSGSGTCRDVCKELGIRFRSFDLRTGFDAGNVQHFEGLGLFDFIWLHPPYWKLISYGADPRCLSNAPTLADFTTRLRSVLRNCLNVLAPDGKLAILMGDLKHRGEYCGLPFRTFNAAVKEGFWLAAPDIIRFSHGATSSSKSYPFPLIPRLHDTCFVLKKKAAA